MTIPRSLNTKDLADLTLIIERPLRHMAYGWKIEQYRAIDTRQGRRFYLLKRVSGGTYIMTDGFRSQRRGL